MISILYKITRIVMSTDYKVFTRMKCVGNICRKSERYSMNKQYKSIINI